MALALLLALVVLCPALAVAQGTPDYQELVRQGVEAQAADDFARAHEAFARAHALYANARALRGMGIASFRAGHFVRAVGELEGALVHPERPLDERLRAGVLDLLERARREVSVVLLSVTPAGARAHVDEVPVPRPEQPLVLEPGPHTLRLSADGYVTQELGFEALRGARQSLRAVLVPQGSSLPAPPVELSAAPLKEQDAPVPSPRAHRLRLIAAWSAGGLTLAAGATAGALYATARQRIAAIDRLCRTTTSGGCSPAEKRAQRREARLPMLERSLNASLFVAAGAAASTLGLLGWDYAANGRRLELWFAADSAGVRGSF
jgi:hypothetical protein